MTDKQFATCVNEAIGYADRDAYISDLCLSTMWDDAEDADISAERIEVLSVIWEACHRSIKEIAAAAGLSQRKLAEHFCIPYRTVEDWCNEKSKGNCPIYTKLMLQECLGLFRRP